MYRMIEFVGDLLVQQRPRMLHRIEDLQTNVA
jgi:hypothetical protein